MTMTKIFSRQYRDVFRNRLASVQSISLSSLARSKQPYAWSMFAHHSRITLQKRKCGAGINFTTAAGDTSRKIRVGLLGARGYVGRELLRLLDEHPDMAVKACVSRSLHGTLVSELVPGLAHKAVPQDMAFSASGGNDPTELADLFAGEVDVWVLAMPNNVAAPFVAALQGETEHDSGPLLIDLSADYRFNADWTYGFPEHHGQRERLANAKRIANPGCYATGAQAALLPLVQAGFLTSSESPPSVFGVSGYSGAGTSPSPKNDTAFLADNIIPYALTNHIHEREVSAQIGVPTHFMPHVAPFFQGISLTVNASLGAPMTRGDLVTCFQEYYKDEPLIRIVDDGEITVKTHGTGQHGVTLGNFTVDEAAQRVVVVSLIDNLLKGAATQCVQNVNLAFGIDEYAGIPLE